MKHFNFALISLFFLSCKDDNNCCLNSFKGNLVAGSLSFGYLERLVLDDQNQVIYREKIAKDIGRVRDVVESPEGYIYLSVENKGIFKLIPK